MPLKSIEEVDDNFGSKENILSLVSMEWMETKGDRCKKRVDLLKGEGVEKDVKEAESTKSKLPLKKTEEVVVNVESKDIILPLANTEWMEIKGDPCEKGMAYLKGDGIEKSVPKALSCLKIAGMLGDAKAFCILGFLYLEGKEVKKNLKEALLYLELSAELGDAEALSYLKKLAGMGNAKALYRLGYLYLKGEEVEKNVKLASRYLSLINNIKNKNRELKLE